VIEDGVRAGAPSLPETTGRPSYGMPGFRVRNKLFATFARRARCSSSGAGILTSSTPTEIRTERLLLRPFRSEDVVAIARYATDEDYRRYLSPTHPGPKQFVAHNVDVNWSVERSWVITLDGEVAGSAFLGINSEDDAAELACLVAREFWGRQIGFEACGAAIEHAFVELDLSKVVARADSRHEASIRLMTKLGMRSKGVARSLEDRQPDEVVDEVIYEISRDDWSRVRSGAR
jgi:[ribosomal protein S5]-alanine N-acetyltransferase